MLYALHYQKTPQASNIGPLVQSLLEQGVALEEARVGRDYLKLLNRVFEYLSSLFLHFSIYLELSICKKTYLQWRIFYRKAVMF